MKTQSGVADLQCENGSMTKTDEEKAEVLNQFFSSVYTVEDLVNIPTKAQTNVQEILSDIDFSSDDIMKILSNLKADKSPGPDKIHPSVLKECADVLAYPLYLLFRKSLNEGSLPQDWKDGYVTPIFKKGLKCQVDNYRPVSLTSVICKVMEKVVRNALLNHLMENSLLADNQHGFVPGRSCVTQLLEVLDKWTEILDNEDQMQCIWTSLKHSILCHTRDC